jgi:hypothetical protein
VNIIPVNFRTPLRVARLGGETKLIVSPWAAIGTDAFGMGLATIAFFSTTKPVLKAVSAAGGLWMLTATMLEIHKLASEDRP